MARNKCSRPSESKAYAFKSRYCALWTALLNIAQTGGADPNGSIVSCCDGDRIVVQTKEDRCLELLGVPAKSIVRTRNVDVHVSFRQTLQYAVDGPFVHGSNVKVTYIEGAGGDKKCKVLETWHYDYSPKLRAHPIYHVQLTGDHLLKGPTTREYHLPYRTPDLDRIPRVPCAPMDLPAVAALLVYDHFPDRLEQLDEPEWTRVALNIPSFPGDHFREQGWKKSSVARAWYPKTTG